MAKAHVEPPVTGEKTCAHCGETKHVLAFCACKKSSDGLYSWCRDCVRKANQFQGSKRKKKKDVSLDRALYGDDPL